MANLEGQQQYILPEGTRRTVGRDAQRMNILVAYAVAQAVRSTLGPKGMDKMLIDDLGDITITNDGATILDEMNVEHPAAKILVEVAKTQDNEVGDGTTTAAVLAGYMLKEAGELLDKGIHPTIILKGYREATKKAHEFINELGMRASLANKELLKKVAATSMTGKGSENYKSKLADIVVSAIEQVAETSEGKITIDTDAVKIEKKAGGSVENTELIKGIVIDKERVHPGMPTKIDNAKIALLNVAIEVKETETDAQIRITDPSQMEAFIMQEEKLLRDMVDKIKASGANVVFCQKGIDDLAQHFLAKEGIFAVRRVKKSDMEKLSKATGARIVTNIHDLSSEDLGESGLVEEKKVGDEKMVFVSKCKDPKAVTILVRGGAEHVVDEVERAIVDAIGSVTSAIEDGIVVVGGGAIEVAAAKKLRAFAQKIGGKEQLAIEKFADALEVIPFTLAESAGMDPIDTIVELRSKHEDPDNGKYYGVDVMEGRVDDMYAKDVIEPAKVKKQALSSASEAVELILRIDDIIAAKGGSKGSPDLGDTGDMGY